PDADGVAEGDLVAPHLPEAPGNYGHRRWRHLPFVGTAEDAGDIPPHPDAALGGGGEEGGETLQALLDGAVDVLLGKGFRGGGKDRHFAGPGGRRRLEPVEVGGENRIADP